jgi:DNA-binding GntR family transcriptional regulator
VRQMSDEYVQDLYQLRSVVEGLAAELAAERITDPAMRTIKRAHEELANSTNIDDFQALSLLNRAFHFAIYRAGSPVVISTIESLWTLFPPVVTIWRDRTVAESLVADHQRIVDAIAEGDARAARDAMASHVLHSAEVRRGTAVSKEQV